MGEDAEEELWGTDEGAVIDEGGSDLLEQLRLLIDTCVAFSGALVDAIGVDLLIPRAVPRTRVESRFKSFYCNLRPEEFRRTFRLPRPLFDTIVEDLRPNLEYRSGTAWVSGGPCRPMLVCVCVWPVAAALHPARRAAPAAPLPDHACVPLPHVY
jgi:hypothetical protein